MEMCSFVRWY